MQSIYEMIRFNNKLPINIFIHSVDNISSHWHSSIEIFFVLSGTVDLIYNGEKYVLKKDDVFLINSNKIHGITSNSKNIVIAAQIEESFVKNNYKDIDSIEFDCKSVSYENEPQAFKSIRKILAKIVWTYNKEVDGYEIKINSLLLDLIYILTNNFKVKANIKNIHANNKHLDRLVRIINYVKENFNNDISLTKVAEKEYLTPQYLSKFFEKNMWINFLTYVNKIRLDHALNDLINTDTSITDIAFNSGFPNVKSFISVFKATYNQTPSIYRKNINSHIVKNKGEQIRVNYLDVDTTSYFKEILEYLSDDDDIEKIKDTGTKIKKKVTIDLNDNLGKIKNNWKNLMTIGKAKEGLLDIVQKQIREIQKDIGYKYIRFHGIFDDEMMIYQEDKLGNVQFNFNYVDSLFDFLLSVNLKPFIELSFMPKDLAKDINHTMYYHESITSIPKSYKNWAFMINALIIHCIERYGVEEVKSWCFEVWNEPDMEAFWSGVEEDYYNLYEVSYRVIKEINKDIKVGGPAIASITIKQTKWLDRYIKYTIDNKCIPDFISFHIYPNEIFDINDNFTHKKGLITDSDINYLSNIIDIVKNKLNEFSLDNIEVYLTEWNSTISCRDLTNDTLYKGSYIFKNILENIDKINSFGYWALSDYIEEFRIDKNIFHGGLGLITNNGIKKSAFYSFKLLNELGGNIVDRGDGYFISKNNNEYKVFLYNYCHFDKIYSMSDVSNIDIGNRYNVFLDKNINIELKLTNFNVSGGYNLCIKELTRKGGSSFDTWVKMGQPMQITKEDIEYINSKSIPNMKKLYVDIDKDYTIMEHLKPHEVKVYTFTKSYL